MKSRMSFMVCAVVLGLLKSLPGMAQAEINPDHFNEEQVVLEGSFTLLHQINYAGLVLPAGVYSLAVLHAGGWNLVTLTPQGAAVSVRARIKCPLGFERPTTLILERSGEQSVLTGISFEQQGTILRLQGGRSGAVSAGSEEVPVSYASGARPPD